jgi:hypothetical protein
MMKSPLILDHISSDMKQNFLKTSHPFKTSSFISGTSNCYIYSALTNEHEREDVMFHNESAGRRENNNNYIYTKGYSMGIIGPLASCNR